MRLFAVLLAAALLVPASCASTHSTRVGGGNPPEDPRGVPVGGAAAAFRPQGIPNFYDATSVGSPGTGAFAGSGPAKIRQHQEAMAGQRPPKRVPEIPAPPRNSL
jgi:hypothetical protein